MKWSLVSISAALLKTKLNNYTILRLTMAEIVPITLTHTHSIVFDYGLLDWNCSSISIIVVNK